MKYDPQKHPFDNAQGRHRRSIRLKGYDYTRSGGYFITAVTYQRQCLFGDIKNGEMQLSSMGQIAREHWSLIPEHFPHAELGAYVVMPDHVHGIIIIHENGMATNSSPSVGASQWDAPTINGPKRGSIGAIIGSYKMSVTRRIQKELNSTGIWQRNYYEHIIRNDEEHNRIILYIEANIDNWVMDNENPLKSK